MKKRIILPYADQSGNVYEYEGLEPVFRSGNRFVPVNRDELIKLPFGSYLFSLPERYPVTHNKKTGTFDVIKKSMEGEEIQAVSSFLASGYLRTYLPASRPKKKVPVLPLWAYAGVVIMDGEFYVPAVRIDDDPRSDPSLHQDGKELKRGIKEVSALYPQNRLVNQLKTCSTQYNCLCARNFFIGRYEAPVPTSPACNADCLGCLSYQEDSGFAESQPRLNFSPDPGEISQVILHHFGHVNEAVASFGQGCEGEPLLRRGDIVRAVDLVRKKETRGTININTNGSDPGVVRDLIDAGLDSIRISMSSPTEKYYTLYHKPRNYTFDDVKKSLEIALSRGIFVSINLFFMPGFTDMESEVTSLLKFLDTFPVNMIQTRNMNIDPDLYFETMGITGSEPEEPHRGIGNLLGLLRENYPAMKLGYYNPPKEKW